MIGCCQKQRRCHRELCCQWTCQGFWWRCFPHRSFSVTDHAATTWCVQAAPWSRQSSLCPTHAQLWEGTRGHELGFLQYRHFQEQHITQHMLKSVVELWGGWVKWIISENWISNLSSQFLDNKDGKQMWCHSCYTNLHLIALKYFLSVPCPRAAGL